MEEKITQRIKELREHRSLRLIFREQLLAQIANFQQQAMIAEKEIISVDGAIHELETLLVPAEVKRDNGAVLSEEPAVH